MLLADIRSTGRKLIWFQRVGIFEPASIADSKIAMKKYDPQPCRNQSQIQSDLLGGAEGDRTPDLMTASHALSQLSYGPV